MALMFEMLGSLMVLAPFSFLLFDVFLFLFGCGLIF